MIRLLPGRPSPVELYTAPELAVLTVLEVAVEVALVALIAAHPDVEREDDDVLPERHAARALVSAAHDLASAASRYRLALARARDREHGDAIPF